VRAARRARRVAILEAVFEQVGSMLALSVAEYSLSCWVSRRSDARHPPKTCPAA
jgi:hypothetical protein